MSDWGWVTLAFATTYVSLSVYTWALRRRLSTARRRLEELQ